MFTSVFGLVSDQWSHKHTHTHIWPPKRGSGSHVITPGWLLTNLQNIEEKTMRGSWWTTQLTIRLAYNTAIHFLFQKRKRRNPCGLSPVRDRPSSAGELVFGRKKRWTRFPVFRISLRFRSSMLALQSRVFSLESSLPVVDYPKQWRKKIFFSFGNRCSVHSKCRPFFKDLSNKSLNNCFLSTPFHGSLHS